MGIEIRSASGGGFLGTFRGDENVTYPDCDPRYMSIYINLKFSNLTLKISLYINYTSKTNFQVMCLPITVANQQTSGLFLEPITDPMPLLREPRWRCFHTSIADVEQPACDWYDAFLRPTPGVRGWTQKSRGAGMAIDLCSGRWAKTTRDNTGTRGWSLSLLGRRTRR